jgi:hypothetical protein
VESRRRKRNQLKGYAYRTWSGPFGRCIAPGVECLGEPIRAHSVQRQGPLRLVSADGHVVMLRQRLDLDQGPTYDFENVGVNKATVFTGLCSDHDLRLFTVIDRHPLDRANAEQLFLYAYRAVLRETHVSIESAAKVQGVYQEKCRLGLADPNVPTRSGILAVERMVVAYETWLYKEVFDDALLAGQYDELVYDCIDLGKTSPCIAVSSLFSLDEVQVADDVARVALTVLPSEDGRSHGLLAYLRRDSAPARKWLDPLLSGPPQTQRYLLSRLILERCDNVALSPVVFAGWSPEKRAVIRDFWASTVLRNNDQFRDIRLDLFESAA